MFWAIYLTTVTSLLYGGGAGFSFGDGPKKISNDRKMDDDFGVLAQKLEGSGQKDRYSGGYKPYDDEARCKKETEIAKVLYAEAVRLCNGTDQKSGSVTESLRKCRSAKAMAQEMLQKAKDSCDWWQWTKPLLDSPSDYLGYMKYREGLKDGSIKEDKVVPPPGWKSGTEEKPWWVDHFRNGKKLSTGMKLWYGLDRLYPEKFRNRDSRRPLTDYMPEKMHLDFVNWKLNQKDQAQVKRLDDKSQDNRLENQQFERSQDMAETPFEQKRGKSKPSDLLQQSKKN